MSKVDAQRAMREAKYAARNAAARDASPGRAARAASAAPAVPTASPAAKPSAGPARPAETSGTEPGRCGHRSMNGRECTRDAGHSEKSHRYT